MDRYDGLLIIGLGLIAIGCAMVAAPLGLIVAGAGCSVMAVIGARNSAARDRTVRGNTTPQARKEKTG